MAASINTKHEIIYNGELVKFDLEFALDRYIEELESHIHIWDIRKCLTFGVNNTTQKKVMQDIAPGIYKISHYVVADLPEGLYTAGFALIEKLPDGSSNELMWYDKLCEFWVSHPLERVGVGYANLPATQILTQMEPLVKNVITDGVGYIICNSVAMQMKSSEYTDLEVEIVNNTDVNWRGDLFRPINLSYHWFDMSDNVVVFSGVCTPIPHGGIPAQGSASATMHIVAPNIVVEGEYRLVLTMVQESIQWFEEIGFQPFAIQVRLNKD